MHIIVFYLFRELWISIYETVTQKKNYQEQQNSNAKLAEVALVVHGVTVVQASHLFLTSAPSGLAQV